MAGALEAMEQRLREELRAVRETRLALERLGMLTLERAVELEREQARIRRLLYELEKAKQEEGASGGG